MNTTSHTPTPKSERTRKRIVDSALALMRANGYQGTTIRDICKKAGVSPASFYSYFETKSDLLQDTYKESDYYFGTELLEHLKDKTFEKQLQIFVKAYAELNIHTGIDMVRVLFNPENIWLTMERPMQKTLGIIIQNGIHQGFFSDTHSCRSLVKELFVVLRGVCYDWCVYGGNYDLELAMLRQVRYFLCGCCLPHKAEEAAASLNYR